MSDRERKLLTALAMMVDQHLDEYMDEVYSHPMSAGEHAIQALAEFGLMQTVGTRFGRWSEAGKQFLEEARKPKRTIECKRSYRKLSRLH
jgi:hypothetical protein